MTIVAEWRKLFEGRIALLEHLEVPEGTRVLVTLLPDDEASFWVAARGSSLAAVWNNEEDDVYAKLLEK